MLVMLLQHGYFIPTGIVLGIIQFALTVGGIAYFWKRDDNDCAKSVLCLSACAAFFVVVSCGVLSNIIDDRWATIPAAYAITGAALTIGTGFCIVVYGLVAHLAGCNHTHTDQSA